MIRLQYSLEVAVLQRTGSIFAVLASNPVSQDCMSASFHFISAHTGVFILLFLILFYRTCVGAEDSIPDPFQSCYEKFTHSDSFSYLSKMAV